MYCNKSSTKECPYSGNRINFIKKNSLVPNKLRPNFQKRYVVILMSKWKSVLKRDTGGPPSIQRDRINRNWNRLKQPIIAILDLVLEDNSRYKPSYYVGDYYAPKFKKINRDLKSQEDAMDIIGTIQELGELLEEEPKGEIESTSGLQTLKKLVDSFLRIGAPKNME